MSIAEALLSIGLLIVVAKLIEGVLSRIGLSSIVAFTAAGILLGPVTGLVSHEGHILIFLEIGVFIFFFLIGLDEIDIPGFMTTIGGRFFVAAMVSMVISIAASLVVTADLLNLGFALGAGGSVLEFTSALSLAGILSLSSLGLVAKVLADKGLLRELIGLRIFTAVIIAEVIALLVVGLTIGEGAEAETTFSLLNVLALVGQIIGFTILIWIVSAKLLPRVMDLLLRFLNVPELSFGLLLGGMFLVVVGAESIGLHGSLGALLFGAALSGLPHRDAGGYYARLPQHGGGDVRPAVLCLGRAAYEPAVPRFAGDDDSGGGVHPDGGEAGGVFHRHLPGAAGYSGGAVGGADGQGRGGNRPAAGAAGNPRDWRGYLFAAGDHNVWVHPVDAAGYRAGGDPGQDAGRGAVADCAAVFRPPPLCRG